MLPENTAKQVLNYLGLEKAAPTLAYLEALLASYVCKVPWESASRIVRRLEVGESARWPDEFWQSAIERGTGGTCFESNYAFFALLRTLGYEGGLTINNMGETIGCHTAAIIKINGGEWLVDAGFPVHVPVPLDANAATRRESPYLTFFAVPDGPDRYQIERDPHPSRNCFTLLTKPVPDDYYTAAMNADYKPGGYFNDAVIINKVINARLWRFSSRERSLHLETFIDGKRIDTPTDGDAAVVAATVARHFEIDESIVRRALEQVNAGAE